MGLSTLNAIHTGASLETAAIAGEHGATRQALSLDGPWQFRTDSNSPWRETQVPGCWESQFPELRGWAGTAVYERTFDAPASFRGMRVVLHFGAVDYFTEVWLNDQFIGTHEGGYTPFAFDVADHLSWEGENRLTVRVTDATPDTDVPLPDGSGVLSFAEIPHGKQSWYTPVSGIWQSVSLEARALVSIERVCVEANLDAGTARVCCALSADAARSENWSVQLDFDAPKGAGEVGSVTLTVPQGETEVQTTVDLPDLRPWSPEHPNLYALYATLKQGDETNDVFHTRFGVRKIETRDGHVWLNNEPYFIIGALDQAFYPRTIYTAPSDDYLRDQFRKAKEMGLNLMRCHIKVPSTRYLDLCDEMGLLVWYEIPNGMILSQEMRRRARQTFQEMLVRDGNHPSIVIKTIMNESWGIDLGEAEQREWLVDTYHWAKKLAPDKLIVDNSACIPNFHLISDLDDYHVYFSIPDQADEFAEWVRTFAEREMSGTYSGFGDASRKNTEPLLISEFGNWGLPRYDSIMEYEGKTPYWFKTGAGITNPDGFLVRFEKQKLGRAFKDYNHLAEASQEQEWIALKYQIEEMRRRREVSGYVVTEFTDIDWEVNGLLDMGRNPKVFHDRLIDIQGQDLLIPRPERYAYWAGETARIAVQFSRFSSRDTDGARLEWRILDLSGTLEAGQTLRSETSDLGEIAFRVPDVEKTTKAVMELALIGRDGARLARNTQPLVFATAGMQTWGRGRSLWLHDTLGLADGFKERAEAAGFRVVETPEPDSLGLITYWDAAANRFVQEGGHAVLTALHPKSLQIAAGLGLRLQERSMNNWWGDWCSSQTWFIPEKFPYLPDTEKFDFEFEKVIPKRVLSGSAPVGLNPANVYSGLFVGWLHNPGAYVVRLPVGKGRLVATTFDVVSDFHADPIATLLLACLADQLEQA